MRGATIITLSPSDSISSVSTFEESFGATSSLAGEAGFASESGVDDEMSEFRGRGRARRQRRKMDRINKRAERKRAKQKMRAEQQEARQERKDVRHSRKASRKAMGEEPESESSEESTEQTDDSTQSSQSEQPETSNDQAESQGDEQSEELTQDVEQGESDEESGFTGAIGFDGVQVMTAEDKHWEDYFSSANGEKIHPKVKELAHEIERTKALIKRNRHVLVQYKTKTDAKSNQIKSTAKHSISQDLVKLHRLEAKLAGYSKAVGDYSEARGGRSSRNGRSARRAEIRVAKKEARKERKAGKRHNSEHGGSETPTEAELNPEFSKQRIEVPAESNMTGLNGLDNQEDIDAPETRTIELMSNADGLIGKKLDWKAVAIGVLIAGGLIYVAKKYKVFGK